MRAGAVLAIAAILLFAGCGTAPDSETAQSSEQWTHEVHIVSGSLTITSAGSPRKPPAHNSFPSDSPPHLTPLPSLGLAGMTIENDNVVYTFFGAGVVDYVGRYVERAVTYSSQEPVDVHGTSILQLDLIWAPAPESGSTVLEPITGAAGSPLMSATTVEPLSGVTQSFLGTSSDRPDFAVTSRMNPPALVVSFF